jgi:putative selenate reductase
VRKFYRPAQEVDLSVSFCGNPAANPVGPAAGPQTQLAQNIVLSWLAGSRILELKTVQINDRLQLTRPCIDMATVGYNTEWSQELALEDSLREYVKASMMVEMLKPWLFPDVKNLDTIFDVSVGYDLAGIQSPQIRQWLRTMRDASTLIEEFRKEIPPEFKAYRELPFKPEIANSITLSTFHGTPADEIERICEFLITDMDYHVVIKMNPPMMGKQRLEYLLQDKLGYTDIEVNEIIYQVNISFNDAVEMVKRLQVSARRQDKTIGVKFGNTLEVKNKGTFLKDQIQYLSGKPLHILHLVLVDEWRKAFGGEFPISFSGSVDANNFPDCVAVGLVPITTCTDLLRPGGYGRLPQYLLNLERFMKSSGATTIPEYIIGTSESSSGAQSIASAIIKNTSKLLNDSIENPRYHSKQNKRLPRKIGSKLYLWDCVNCDKCIPVCPNDSNFYFEIEPVEIVYKNIDITGDSWREIEGGTFKIEEKHQIANFADACNDCGNCDVFCPEDGGPYIEKPRFFGSLESYNRQRPSSGFFLTIENTTPTLYGRFKNKEFVLRKRNDPLEYVLSDKRMEICLDETSIAVKSVKHNDKNSSYLIDMRYFFVMRALLEGMLDTKRVHFVNAGIGSFTEARREDAR